MNFVTTEESKYEYTENRSRFIGVCRRVRTDDEASNVLAEIRKQYRDCTHVCYAYITCESARSSDDGEPAGTAGLPIMETIRNAGVKEVLVAVVRYFGGVKLGAGGLLRAYAHTAAQTLAAAVRREVADCVIYKVAYDYAVYKKIEKRQLQSLYKIMDLTYNSAVTVIYAVQVEDAFLAELRALTQGKCDCMRMGVQKVERTLT